MKNYSIRKFPDSRIASIDVCEIGKQKHHVTGLVEIDVTESRRKIREHNRVHSGRISFNAWLISVIGTTMKKYDASGAYLSGKNKLIVFDDINVSVVVEKDVKGSKVPIPLVIEKANEASVESITRQIADAKHKEFTAKDFVLQKKTRQFEKIYYYLPGFLRRYFWKILLRNPKLAYRKMGNAAFTSIGMMGKVHGWFIPVSVHPICFGIGSVVKKPSVVDNKIEIREMLQMSVLIDHDVMDGAPMARFISELSKNIEKGLNLSECKNSKNI